MLWCPKPTSKRLSSRGSKNTLRRWPRESHQTQRREQHSLMHSKTTSQCYSIVVVARVASTLPMPTRPKLKNNTAGPGKRNTNKSRRRQTRERRPMNSQEKLEQTRSVRKQKKIPSKPRLPTEPKITVSRR